MKRVEALQEIERIVWIDSNSHDGWHDPTFQKYGVVRCTSFGFLVDESEEHITLGQSQAHSDEAQIAATITIPKVAVISRTLISMEADP